MDARRQILSATPRSAPPEAPRYAGPTQTFHDPVAAFRNALEAAGGSLVVGPEAPAAPFLESRLAVAECGAVWWVPRDETERREAFLAERMVIRVGSSDLVHTLHDAYARITMASSPSPPYACFVSGPSKTADIEQALVIGAHGPRELEVWLSSGG